MNVTVEPLTSWKSVKEAALATVWKEPTDVEPSSKWKRKILLARHSPIEALEFMVTFTDIPYWVSVHLVRHKIGITHWVGSQRDDRHDNPAPRAEMPQGTLINHKMKINAQALIAVSRKRLCALASPETRVAWLAVLRAMEPVDPDMAWAMRPECWWSGDKCPEMRGCGKCPSRFAELEAK